MSPDADQHEQPNFRSGLALALGVVAVSAGAIFTRYAQQEAGSLSIAAYRMGIAFVVVLFPAVIIHRRELFSLSRRDLGLAALSGLFLAVHFATWIYSLELTSVAVSVVLVNTAPLWVGLLAPLVTRERLSRATGTGIVIAVTGAVMIGCGFRGEGSASNNIAGGILATIGAIGLAGYLLFGRNLRRRHSLWVYVTICYGSAAFYLFLAALCAGQKLTGFSAPVWLYMAVMALVCQILGHTTNNWALRFFSASMISVALLGEPICSTLLAWMIFGETLTLIQVGGSVLVFAGIYVVSRCSAPSQIC